MSRFPHLFHYILVMGIVTGIIFIFSVALIPLTTQAQTRPFLVPDRPGYSDSTHTVLPKRWHLELGGALTPESDFGATTLIRYGIAERWELRLAGPTLLQNFAQPSAIDPEPTPLPLTVGGPSIGAKWAHRVRDLQSSIALMVGIPITGAQTALSPDPLVALTAQTEHPLDSKISVNLALRFALIDQTLPAQVSAYGEDLGALWGIVGALSWSEIDWSIYAQGGAESVAELITPLVGLGSTLRLAYNFQLDLSVNAPLAADGVDPRFEFGLVWGI